MTDCPAKKEWCKGLTNISGVLMLIIAVQSLTAVAQERRIKQMEEKNDTIVELKTDMRYVKDGLSEIKTMLRSKQ